MGVYKDGANWQDRILNAYPPASDGERYYKLVRADGSTVEEAVKLELLNTVLPGNEGTPANAGNFNSILAAMGTAKKNYSEAKITEPYRDSLIGYMDFAGGLSPTVGTFTLTGTSVNQISGPHSNSKGYQGTGASSGITLNTKLIPRGAKTIRFRIYLAAATAQTLIDETNGSTANYGLYVTVNTSRIINFQIMNGGSAIVNINSATIPLTTWTDVIFTWDGTTKANRVRVYVNGNLSNQGTATATQASLEPTNNTVLLNRAPISTAGGTAAISEIEVYNEAIYADAYVLEQKGFSLFDGAKVRIKWGFSLGVSVEVLLNINNSGNVPVDIAETTANTWVDLIYNSSTKKYVHSTPVDSLLVDVASMATDLPGREQNVSGALELLSRFHRNFGQEYIWPKISGSLESAQFIQSDNSQAMFGRSSNQYWLHYGPSLQEAAAPGADNRQDSYQGVSYLDYYTKGWTFSSIKHENITSSNYTSYLDILKNNYWYADQRSNTTFFRQAYKGGSSSTISNQSNDYYLTNCAFYYYLPPIDGRTITKFTNNGTDDNPESGTFWDPIQAGHLFSRAVIGSYIGTGSTSLTLDLGTGAKYIQWLQYTRYQQRPYLVISDGLAGVDAEVYRWGCFLPDLEGSNYYSDYIGFALSDRHDWNASDTTRYYYKFGCQARYYQGILTLKNLPHKQYASGGTSTYYPEYIFNQKGNRYVYVVFY